MSDKSLADREFIESLEAQLQALHERLEEAQEEVDIFAREHADAQARADRILDAMKSIRTTMVIVSGEDCPNHAHGDFHPQQNARHAVLGVLAERGAPVSAKDIVEHVACLWGHSGAAIRSALVRALADEEVVKVKRGVYQIEKEAQEFYAHAMEWYADNISGGSRASEH